MHLSDAFIQSDLQCIQVIYFFCQYMCSLGIEPTTFALLTQCSTTEPQEHCIQHVQNVLLQINDTAKNINIYKLFIFNLHHKSKLQKLVFFIDNVR